MKHDWALYVIYTEKISLSLFNSIWCYAGGKWRFGSWFIRVFLLFPEPDRKSKLKSGNNIIRVFPLKWFEWIELLEQWIFGTTVVPFEKKIDMNFQRAFVLKIDGEAAFFPFFWNFIREIIIDVINLVHSILIYVIFTNNLNRKTHILLIQQLMNRAFHIFTCFYAWVETKQ